MPKTSKSPSKKSPSKKSPSKSKSNVIVSPIAQPMAGKKLRKKLLKLCDSASSDKSVRRGVKEVVKALRKEEKGICLIAGDVSPIDVITHIPIMCEDADVPYVYVTSRAELGTASATKRPTSVVLIKPSSGKDWSKTYKSLKDEVKECKVTL
mmetsp:Transcript_2191/g.3652  ORF Transcript_2191/g.3652 Transcript_2191/m.3652 type:complete len:152 (-) Transcript_2191:48-503(-)